MCDASNSKAPEFTYSNQRVAQDDIERFMVVKPHSSLLDGPGNVGRMGRLKASFTPVPHDENDELPHDIADQLAASYLAQVSVPVGDAPLTPVQLAKLTAERTATMQRQSDIVMPYPDAESTVEALFQREPEPIMDLRGLVSTNLDLYLDGQITAEALDQTVTFAGNGDNVAATFKTVTELPSELASLYTDACEEWAERRAGLATFLEGLDSSGVRNLIDGLITSEIQQRLLWEDRLREAEKSYTELITSRDKWQRAFRKLRRSSDQDLIHLVSVNSNLEGETQELRNQLKELETACEPGLQKMDVDNGTANMEVRTKLARRIAYELGLTLREGNKWLNFITMEVGHPEVGPLVLTVQRKSGITPVQKVAMLKSSLKEMVEFIEGVQGPRAVMFRNGEAFRLAEELAYELGPSAAAPAEAV